MIIKNMRTNQVVEPIGFITDYISFSWTVEDAGSATKRIAAQVKVWKDTPEGQPIFDSGMDEKASSIDYTVEFELLPRTRYYWVVTVVADNREQATGISWFETGKREEAWLGQWITPQIEASIHPKVGTDFAICKEIKSARFYLCGLGLHEVYFNGQKAGDEYLAPGYHSYDLHLQTYTYDVTNILEQGENNCNVMLGNGWFKGRIGFEGGYTDLYGDKFYLIGELHISYVDGTHDIIATNDTWKAGISPVVESGIYDGETYDSRLEGEPMTSDVSYEVPKHCGSLCDRFSLPVVKKETFAPIELIHTPKDEWILDFGQNLTGWVEFDNKLEAGESITLTACETLQNGCFYHDNLRTAKTEFTYVSSGKKKHVRPRFTFYGFRYMKVDSPKPVNKEEFIAYHLRSDIDQIGTIETANENVNRLFQNALWSQKDNFLDVPSDCPQRDERLGWTGDAQIFSNTASYNMYVPAFFRKYMWDMRAEQKLMKGSAPNVVPRIKKGMVAECGLSPWADSAVIIPWNIYVQYGSVPLLKEMYSGMKEWIDFEYEREQNAGNPYLVNGGFHFADWLALDNLEPGPLGATDSLYIASAYYYKCAEILSKSANVIGVPEDAQKYDQLARNIYQAIQEKYFDENGICICNTQTAAALALEFNLSSIGRDGEAAKLERLLAENNGHLNTGFVGTPILCPALSNSGYHERAVSLLLNEEYPGWLYAVNLGATTIWERWNSVMPDGSMNPEGMNSLNHYAYGSIEEWMYRVVCGIKPVESAPGFKKAVIAPKPDQRLGYAKAELKSAAGIYKSGWYYEGGKLVFEVTIPFDAEAEVILPESVKDYMINGTEMQDHILSLKCGSYVIMQK